MKINTLKFFALITAPMILMPNICDAAATTNMEFGMLCMYSFQCKSRICQKLGYSGTGLLFCVKPATAGEECYQGISDTYLKPPCEAGLKCAQPTTQFGSNKTWCIDPNFSCETCNIWAPSGESSEYAGYQKYSHGKCDADCGMYDTAYRCAEGYYGISYSSVITSLPPTGCFPCPENGLCYKGNNETFYCKSGYYKTPTGCTRCPDVGADSSGTVRYGQTQKYMNMDDVESCYASSGTYTGMAGAFELSTDCNYTN